MAVGSLCEIRFYLQGVNVSTAALSEPCLSPVPGASISGLALSVALAFA